MDILHGHRGIGHTWTSMNIRTCGDISHFLSFLFLQERFNLQISRGLKIFAVLKLSKQNQS